jgi:hypothetical protein
VLPGRKRQKIVFLERLKVSQKRQIGNALPSGGKA